MIRTLTICLACLVLTGFGGCRTDDAATTKGDGSASTMGHGDFVTATHDGELFVAKKGTPGAEEISEKGRLAKPITAIGARVDGMKVMAPDEETLYAFLDW